ncbi:enediyne biosynthesis protein UnbU [Streptosporangium sp. DT93]|uniref:enediyne biosynthesis protein UnbU n=1 Tax=Streptosporangium sp. DT93 TaxID=3393428 RepID=UPI003CF8B045
MRTGRALQGAPGTYRSAIRAHRDDRRGRNGRGRVRALRWAAASLTLLTVLGHTVLGFESPWSAPVAGVLTGTVAELVLEAVDAWAGRRPVRYLGVPRDRVADFLLPSYVCGLLCAMLLYGSGHATPVVVPAVLIGVGSRYVLRVRASGRPLLNPVATGVAVVLLLLPRAAPAPPHQFTAWVSGPFDVIVPSAVLAAGAVHAVLAGRVPLLLGWTGGFAAQALVRGWLTDVPALAALLPMTGAAFALYACHVVADPATSPVPARRQVRTGLATAAVYGLLAHSHVVSAMFLAPVVVCAGRALWPVLLARAGRAAATSPNGRVSRSPDPPVREPAGTPPGGPP